MSKLIKCQRCNNLHKQEEMVKLNSNEFYCTDCITTCDECGCIEFLENLICINENTDNTIFVCSDCAHNSSYIFKCIECGKYFTSDANWGEYQGGHICSNCSSEYFVCSCCTYTFPCSQMQYDEQNRSYICTECMNDRYYNLENIIEEYSYKPMPVFFGESMNNTYLGIELEVDNTNDNCDCKLIYQAAEKLIEKYEDKIYLKRDGSLSRGFEIVSHPCTLDYHTNEFEWKNIIDICLEAALCSHNTSTCGLHIHLSRTFFGDNQETQDLHISKLLILVSKFYDSHLLKFSRRKQIELRWCENPYISCDNNDTECTIVDKMKQIKSKGRYMAINLQNQHTIEFRLFKGTLNINTLLASLQFVVEISRYAINTDLKEIPTTKWSDIFISTKFKELRKYLEEKELI